MLEITLRSTTRGAPGWFFGKCGLIAAHAPSDNQNNERRHLLLVVRPCGQPADSRPLAIEHRVLRVPSASETFREACGSEKKTATA